MCISALMKMPAGCNSECLHCQHQTIRQARGTDLASNIKTHKEKGSKGNEMEKHRSMFIGVKSIGFTATNATMIFLSAIRLYYQANKTQAQHYFKCQRRFKLH